MRDIFSKIDKKIINEIYKEKSISKDSQEMISFIINFEWDQFDKVKGLNGRASCQDSAMEFMIMRLAQYISYNNKVISLIYEDMKEAKKENFNPIFDKYARMMEITDKEGYYKIKDSLSSLSPVKENILKSIKNTLNKKSASLPDELNKVRPDQSMEKRVSSTDYFIGEISFMSLKTLWAIEEMVKDKNHNLVEKIYENTLYLYKELNYGARYDR